VHWVSAPRANSFHTVGTDALGSFVSFQFCCELDITIPCSLKGSTAIKRISLSADLANEQARAALSHLGLQESEQVGVHVFFLGRAQAMRGALVNLQGHALNEFGLEQAGVGERNNLVVVSLYDERRYVRTSSGPRFDPSRRTP
jgi:hypothetical protein